VWGQFVLFAIALDIFDRVLQLFLRRDFFWGAVFLRPEGFFMGVLVLFFLYGFFVKGLKPLVV
jgi:hypothetical protein